MWYVHHTPPWLTFWNHFGENLHLSFLMNFASYIPGLHLHLEPKLQLACYHHKQPLAFKKHCYTYHRINSVLKLSDLIITWPMHMCSCFELTLLVNSREGPRFVLSNHRNLLTIIYCLETYTTSLWCIHKETLHKHLLFSAPCFQLPVKVKGTLSITVFPIKQYKPSPHFSPFINTKQPPVIFMALLAAKYLQPLESN